MFSSESSDQQHTADVEASSGYQVSGVTLIIYYTMKYVSLNTPIQLFSSFLCFL